MKPATPVRKGESPRAPRRLDDPPPSVISELESAACKDLFVARLTLGLYGSIIGDKPSRLFPGYVWTQIDIAGLPSSLRPAAHRLIEWGQMPGGILNQIFASRLAIIKAVRAIRRRSPHGQKCLKIVTKLRRQYPLIREPWDQVQPKGTKLESVNILEDAVGLPLSERTMCLARAFKPSIIQIAGHDDFMAIERVPGEMDINLNPDGYTVESIQFIVEVDRLTTKPQIIEGVLEDFFETGSEGVWWALVDDENFGYDNLHIIKPGDHLTILDQLGHKLWSGIIRYDRKAGWRRYPLNPKYGQPCALGHWVHWTQKGFKPDDWARFFIRPEYDRLRGVLRKARANKT
jgi:hypothetical protein